MKTETKQESYNENYQWLKSQEGITDLSFPKGELKNYEAHFTAFSIFFVHWKINGESNAFVMNASFSCEKKTDKEIMDFLHTLFIDKERYKAIQSWSDRGKGILKLQKPLVRMTDEKSKEMVRSDTALFLSCLKDFSKEVEAFLNEKEPLEKTESDSKLPEISITDFMTEKMVTKPTTEKENKKTEANLTTSQKTTIQSFDIKPEERSKEAAVQKPKKENEKHASNRSKGNRSLEQEKQEFLQHKKDTGLLFKKKEEELLKQEAAAKAREEETTQMQQLTKKQLKEVEAEQKEVKTLKEALDKREQALVIREQALTKAQEEINQQKINWESTTPDEKYEARRRNLEEAEKAFYEKEKEFHSYEERKLSEIEARLDEVLAKEKKLLGDKEEQTSAKKEMETYLAKILERNQACEQREKQIALKEDELSDFEAKLQRMDILRKETENEKKRLSVFEKELQQKEMVLAEKEADLKQLEEKYEKVAALTKELSAKEEELAKVATDLSVQLHENTQLKQKLESGKNAKQTIKQLNTKIESLEKEMGRKYKTIKEMKDKIASLQKENTKKEQANHDLRKNTEKIQLELAGVRSELYELKENGTSSKELTDAYQRIDELIAEVKTYEKESNQNRFLAGELEKMMEENKELYGNLRTLRELLPEEFSKELQKKLGASKDSSKGIYTGTYKDYRYILNPSNNLIRMELDLTRAAAKKAGAFMDKNPAKAIFVHHRQMKYTLIYCDGYTNSIQQKMREMAELLDTATV